MSDETSPADGWGFKPIGTDNIPTHCGGYAMREDNSPVWVCDACDAHVRVGDIPGWTPRVNTLGDSLLSGTGTSLAQHRVHPT